MASISVRTSYNEDREELTFNVSASDMQSGYTGSRRIYYRIGGYSGAELITGSGTYDSISVTVDVTPGTTYSYSFSLQFKNADATSWSTAQSTTGSYSVPKKITVEKWSWTSSNGSAGDSQTSAAYSAVTGKGKLSNFSYLVWNDLCDKVKEILDSLGRSWDTTYASYSATRMTSSDKKLTAVRFNSLRRNVSTSYSAVSRGSTVYGSYFTGLASQINSWIDSL